MRMLTRRGIACGIAGIAVLLVAYIFNAAMSRWSSIYYAHVAYHERKLQEARADRDYWINELPKMKARSNRLDQVGPSYWEKLSWPERAQAYRLDSDIESLTEWTRPSGQYDRLAEHHKMLRAKYESAARYPWRPVAPDPPAPE